MLPLAGPRFNELLIRKNAMGESGLEAWVFCPGMLFCASHKWWGDRGPRASPHEGLDLLLYRDRLGRIGRIDQETRIPLLFNGVVVNIIDDFLGSSIMVEHRLQEGGMGRLLTIYGHTAPLTGLHPGSKLQQGDILGTLADPVRSGSRVIPHLHISVGQMHAPVSYGRINWETIWDLETLTLLNPLDILGWEYEILKETDPLCGF